jgi:TRAP-type C4-dicarboxylate transport system substrate-binding protein
VQKYLSITQHVYSPGVVLLSTKVWDNLNDAERKCFKAAGQLAGQATRARSYKDAAEGVAELKRQGMVVAEDIDRQAFEDALVPVYAEFSKKFGKDKIDAIKQYKF